MLLNEQDNNFDQETIRFFTSSLGVVFEEKTKNKMDKIEDGNEWNFLKEVFNILDKGNVLDTSGNTKIVDFKHPAELKVNQSSEIFHTWHERVYIFLCCKFTQFN